MQLKNLMYSLAAIIIIFFNSSCKKFLDEKSDAKLVVPASQKDLQALMDDYTKINFNEISCMEISSDDYYLSYNDWNALASDFMALHIWQPENIFKPVTSDWLNPYQIIYSANTVLEKINDVEKEPLSEWKNIQGQAYYHRAKSLLLLASAWCLAYDSATANNELGLPLRLSTNFNETSVRSSLAQTYNQIISDCKQAINFLPQTPVHVVRPSKPAAYALMARLMLFMRRYPQAESYADSALQLKNTLLDYNTLNPTANYPIAQFNVEVIMENRFGSSTLSNSKAKIDSVLYASYEANDLRKTVFFKNNNNGTYGFKGSYEGATTFFSGIATDELYLIKAECLARRNAVTEAMDRLNLLLQNRYKVGTFIPFTATNKELVLQKILLERRKELLMRSLRWMDVKRRNKEGHNISMKRILNNEIYTLAPNDLRYALPIPEDVISLSGMPQNPR